MSEWMRICEFDDLTPDRGAAALVNRRQVALFRLRDDDRVYAIAHRDPFSGANVLARGLVGSLDDVPTVASPMHKQVFDLRTGHCVDQPEVRVDVWETRVLDGFVEVRTGPSNVA